METDRTGRRRGRNNHGGEKVAVVVYTRPCLELVFVCQMLGLHAVNKVPLFKLTRRGAETPGGKLLVALFSNCLGYLLSNPELQKLVFT